MPVLASYRNQSIYLLRKSIEWFLYETNTAIYRVNPQLLVLTFNFRVWVPVIEIRHSKAVLLLLCLFWSLHAENIFVCHFEWEAYHEKIVTDRWRD